MEKELLDLLHGKEWPEAAPDFLICNETNEEDKFERAEGILDYVNENLKDKKFLDFGCGEGHVVKKAFKKGALSIGYDLIQSGNLEWNNDILTTDWEVVENNGPFDFILLYDVLDHVENPVEVLNKIKKVCNLETKVFVRCHPFTCRHGGHLYHKMNKAFIHFIFTEEELAELGLKVDIIQKTYTPIKDNNKWFSDAGFKVTVSDTITTPVEDFFKNPIFMKKLPIHLYGNNFPEFQMSQQFNDYVLKI